MRRSPDLSGLFHFPDSQPNFDENLWHQLFIFIQKEFMEENIRKGSNDQQNQNAQQGQYKNIETSVNDPSSFDDSYESKKEDKISEDEAKTEREGRVGKS